MPCQNVNWQIDYSQARGVTPEWYLQNDGCNSAGGCIPVAPVVPQFRRRFSPYCGFTEVTPQNPQVYYQVAGSVQTDDMPMTFNHQQVYMEVRRKGNECGMVASYPAWRRDANGWIGFYFDDQYFGSPPGYYIGDVFINCCYCFSVQFYLPYCAAVVTGCYTQPALELCGGGECSIADEVGMGTIGGLDCDTTSTSCGGVAPYFPIDNPQVPPTPVCPSESGCPLIPQSPTTVCGG